MFDTANETLDVNLSTLDLSTQPTTMKLKNGEAASLAISDGTNNLVVVDTMNETLDINLSTLDMSTQSTQFKVKTNDTSALSVHDGVATLLALNTTETGKVLDLNIPVKVNAPSMDMSNQDTTLKIKAGQATSMSIKHGTTSVVKIDTTGTASTTPTTGAVQITGGVGVQGQVTTETLTATGLVTLENASSEIRHTGTNGLTIKSTSGKIVLDSAHNASDAIKCDGKLTLANIGGSGDSLAIDSEGAVTRDGRVTTNTNNIGTLSNLVTDNKTDLVQAINSLISDAPAELNTLKEIADSLGSDYFNTPVVTVTTDLSKVRNALGFETREPSTFNMV